MKIKCAVVCTESSGSPTIIFRTVTVSKAGYNLGDHYDKAKRLAKKDGYEDPMIVLDRNEGPAWLWQDEIKVQLGKHRITEHELRERIIDKIPKPQFARIIKNIEQDLDKGK